MSSYDLTLKTASTGSSFTPILKYFAFPFYRDLLDQFISTETDILVFMYRENNLNDIDIVDQLEHIDDELEEKGMYFLKIVF